MNNPRAVFKELSELYQFHKKLAKAYSIPFPAAARIAESTIAVPVPPPAGKESASPAKAASSDRLPPP